VSKTVRQIAIFGELNETESSAITDRVVQLDLKRGQDLVREGHRSDAIFVVQFGRFSVYVKSRSEPVAEISAGELIGEIGFFPVNVVPQPSWPLATLPLPSWIGLRSTRLWLRIQ
jgi:NTE family protein